MSSPQVGAYAPIRVVGSREVGRGAPFGPSTASTLYSYNGSFPPFARERASRSGCENHKMIGLGNSGLDSVQQSPGLDIVLLDGPL